MFVLKNMDYIMGAVISILLLIYLVYVIFKPEEF